MTLLKKIKKLKGKDIVKGLKTVTGFVPGGDIIRQGIEAAEKNYASAKASIKKKEEKEQTLTELKTESDSNKNTLLYLAVAAAVIYFIIK